MKKYNIEEEIPHLIPHFIHLMVGVATLVLTSSLF